MDMCKDVCIINMHRTKTINYVEMCTKYYWLKTIYMLL